MSRSTYSTLYFPRLREHFSNSLLGSYTRVVTNNGTGLLKGFPSTRHYTFRGGLHTFSLYGLRVIYSTRAHFFLRFVNRMMFYMTRRDNGVFHRSLFIRVRLSVVRAFLGLRARIKIHPIFISAPGRVVMRRRYGQTRFVRQFYHFHHLGMTIPRQMHLLQKGATLGNNATRRQDRRSSKDLALTRGVTTLRQRAYTRTRAIKGYLLMVRVSNTSRLRRSLLHRPSLVPIVKGNVTFRPFILYYATIRATRLRPLPNRTMIRRRRVTIRGNILRNEGFFGNFMGLSHPYRASLRLTMVFRPFLSPTRYRVLVRRQPSSPSALRFSLFLFGNYTPRGARYHPRNGKCVIPVPVLRRPLFTTRRFGYANGGYLIQTITPRRLPLYVVTPYVCVSTTLSGLKGRRRVLRGVRTWSLQLVSKGDVSCFYHFFRQYPRPIRRSTYKSSHDTRIYRRIHHHGTLRPTGHVRRMRRQSRRRPLPRGERRRHAAYPTRKLRRTNYRVNRASRQTTRRRVSRRLHPRARHPFFLSRRPSRNVTSNGTNHPNGGAGGGNRRSRVFRGLLRTLHITYAMTMHRGQLTPRTSHRNSRTSSRNHLTHYHRNYSHHHTINRRRPITRKKNGPYRRTTSPIKRAGNRRLARRLQFFRNEARVGNRRHTIFSSMTRVTTHHRGVTRRANDDHATSTRIRRRGRRQIGGTISRHTRGVTSRTFFCYTLYARRRHRTIKRSGGQHARYGSLGVPLYVKGGFYV